MVQPIVVHQSTPKSADIIVIALDAHGAGVLEAADLVQRGISNRVAVFAEPPTSVDREFVRRGLLYEDRASISIRQLQLLGIKNIEIIPRVSGSEDEGRVLPNWCVAEHYYNVVLVTSPDHSRRLSRILRRSARGHQTSITIHNSQYSEFSVESWWSTRSGVRTAIFELEKLALDVLRHPIS